MSLDTINWKRGLLRLWAVAAVLWVGFVLYASNLLGFWSLPAYSVANLIRGDVAIDCYSCSSIFSYDEALGFTENPAAYNAVDLSELRATRTREINVRMPDSAIITRVPPNTTQDELRYKFKEHLLWKPLSILRVSLAPIFQSTVLFFLFFPPFMLLALGYIGLWVGRGFRKW